MRMGFVFVVCWLVSAVARAEPVDAQDDVVVDDAMRDSDQDGLSDALEIATGTEPLRADTDRDSVPDGIEDVDRDGRVDEGESDPRVAGLYPGAPPHIPEPLLFDLVRGLGAERDEVEVNTLSLLRVDHGQTEVLWASEIEWAFAKGHALELELPMHGRELESLKLAVQSTLPARGERFVHGIQTIGEYLLGTGRGQAVALYIVGGRVAGWSFLAMAGWRGTTPLDRRAAHEVLVNPSLYVDVREHVTVGVEANVALGLTGARTATALGQVHWQLTRRVRLQLGAGVSKLEGRVLPTVGTRFVLE